MDDQTVRLAAPIPSAGVEEGPLRNGKGLPDYSRLDGNPKPESSQNDFRQLKVGQSVAEDRAPPADQKAAVRMHE